MYIVTAQGRNHTRSRLDAVAYDFYASPHITGGEPENNREIIEIRRFAPQLFDLKALRPSTAPDLLTY